MQEYGFGTTVQIGFDGAPLQVAEQNKGITPVFFIEPVKNPAKTAEAGRPVFDDEERVRIFVAGDPYNQVVHPVDDAIRARFPDAYDNWKNKKAAMTVSGTPLRQWALLQPNQIAEFEALKIFNVEGLANMSETSVMKGTGLREWRAKAQAYLESSKDSAVAVKLAGENEQLKSDIADLKEQLAQLSTQVASINSAKAQPKR